MDRSPRDAMMWAVILGIWSVVGLLLTLGFDGVSLSEAIVRGFADAYLWAAVTGVAVLITRKFPIGQAPHVRAFLIHFAAGIILPPIRLLVYVLVWDLAGEVPRGVPFTFAGHSVVYLAALRVG